MRCLARGIIAARSRRFRTKSLYKDRVIADQVDAVASETLNIWLFELALIDLLVEPLAPNTQFTSQAWNGPVVTDHVHPTMLMQQTYLAMS